MTRLKTLFTAIVLLGGLHSTQAQVSMGGKPYSFDEPLNDNLAGTTRIMPQLDVARLRINADAAYHKGEILPAGEILAAGFNPGNAGVWTTLNNGDRIWRLKIQVPDAPATSLYFENFRMPKGARFFIYNAEKTHVIGGFGDHNNHESGVFATEIIYTDQCVIEYYEPANVRGQGTFTISGIANVYNAPPPPPHVRLTNPKCCGFGTSGSCNVNVNCPEGASWTNQRNSVARILVKNGANQGWCSGALVNNVAQDCKNYFLSANHCGASASAADKNAWVFYFNYQSAGCTNGASEPSSNTITGAVMRSSTSNGANSSVVQSDFLLLELNGTIPASYNVYFAGWDASGTGSNSGVSIHHPAGDIKKISTYTSALVSRRYYSQAPDNSHWEANWVPTATNTSITEGGSSGSPLFNAAGRIVGKLSGGPSFCGATGTSRQDYYGKISFDWTFAAGASQQLKVWLDPGNTGTLAINGRAACGAAGCPDIQEPNNTQATAGTIVPGTTYKALIANSTDNDYYKFTTSGTTNISISLTTLPFDYELQLLNSAGTVLSSSTAGGTTSESITLNNAAAGTYTVRVFGYNGANSATSCYTLLANTTAVSTCSNTFEPNETLAAAASINFNSDHRSQIASATDVDWFRFGNTAAQPNIQITLTTLPADYDVFLYNSAGTQIGSSEAGSTTSETITFNTTTVGTYYIRVIGYNGAFSTSQCYTLRANISATAKSTAGSNMSDASKAIKQSVQVYPNPTEGLLNISFESNGGEENIVVTDITGRAVLSQKIVANRGRNQVKLNLPAALGEGVYMVKVGSRNPVRVTRQ